MDVTDRFRHQSGLAVAPSSTKKLVCCCDCSTKRCTRPQNFASTGNAPVESGVENRQLAAAGVGRVHGGNGSGPAQPGREVAIKPKQQKVD